MAEAAPTGPPEALKGLRSPRDCGAKRSTDGVHGGFVDGSG